MGTDGVKEFDLIASIIDWEVEPGVVVKGWAYNGQIPGPVMHANVGDKIRIVLKNELPESTSMHLHGIRISLLSLNLPLRSLSLLSGIQHSSNWWINLRCKRLAKSAILFFLC